MDNTQKSKSYAELKALKEEHGTLTSCSYSSSSSGMMFNSNSLSSISVRRDGGDQMLTYSSKLAFGGSILSVYRVKEDVLAKVRELVERENLAALAQLKYHQEIMMTDQSSSENIYLSFDDRELGGGFVSRNIDVDALSQHGAGEVADELHALLMEAMKNGELLDSKMSDQGMMGMGAFANMMMQASDKKETWTCSKCGSGGLSGKFCTECGAPRPENA